MTKMIFGNKRELYQFQFGLQEKGSLFRIADRSEILNLGHCDLPFDVAQGGELAEPFVICDLGFYSGKQQSFHLILC
jgi:hypothetical protein